MNQEIKAAIERTSTLPPAPDSLDPDFDKLLEGPHTLATLGAALSCCPHPDRCVVDARVVRDGRTDEIAWCAACGAMAIAVEHRRWHWERPAIVQQYTADHFAELDRIEHVLQLVADGAKQGGDALEAHPAQTLNFASSRTRCARSLPSPCSRR